MKFFFPKLYLFIYFKFLKWCGTCQKKLLLAFSAAYLNKSLVFLFMH